MKDTTTNNEHTNYQNPDKIRIERAEGKNSEPVYSFILMGKTISLNYEQRSKIENILNETK